MALSLYLVVALALALISQTVLRRWRSSSKHGMRPPGPPPKFLIGNALDFPSPDGDPSQHYIEWGKKYNSDILFASALNNHILVLNKQEDAEKILEERSMLFSNRPMTPLVPMLGWEGNVALMHYGNDWRMHRKICQQNFRREASPSYTPIITSEVTKLLNGLLHTPERLEDHIKMFSVAIPLRTMYGHESGSLDDRVIKVADESAMLGASILSPGGSMVSIFPFIRHIPAWVPGTASKKIAARIRELTAEMTRIPLDNLAERMAKGMTAPSLVSNFFEKKASIGASDHEESIIKNVALTVYGAASETTLALVGSFFYALVTHPEAQKKGHEEIMRVVGPHRLPDFEDRDSLPYVEAMYRELMRWQPPVPIGLPHTVSEDDVYKGYFIPKGTAVFGNIWSITHNEEKYPEPNVFKPERFFTADGQLNDDDHIWAYGFGRRVCVGQHVASCQLWLVIVSVLATLSVTKSKDSNGRELEVNDEYENFGLVRHKKAYPNDITCRSDEYKRLIGEALVNA